MQAFTLSLWLMIVLDSVLALPSNSGDTGDSGDPDDLDNPEWYWTAPSSHNPDVSPPQKGAHPDAIQKWCDWCVESCLQGFMDVSFKQMLDSMVEFESTV